MLLLFALQLLRVAWSFNIDTKTPYIVYGSSWQHFGFSVALHKNGDERKLLVGAPTANTAQPGVDNAGSIYQCTIPSNLEVPRAATSCSQQVSTFDSTGNRFLYIDSDGNPDMDAQNNFQYNYDSIGYQQENKTGQWLGVTLKSNGDYAVACAHRFIRVANRYLENTYDTQPIGKCSVVTGDLSEQVSEYVPCWGDTTGYEMTSCQVGSSLAMSSDSLVFGGPGAYQGEGQAYMSTQFEESKSTTTEPQDAGSAGAVGQWYMGYSTALCDVNGDGKEDLITAAPRAETYMGKLFVYNKNGNVLNKQKELNGKQIGEYFGYSLDCGDVNGDGFDDVIVGAPYYSRDTSGQARLQSTGRVYVFYGSREDYLSAEPTVVDGGIVERTQFGHAVKIVGDINKDGYEDVLIGAPFNSNGIVYLHLGSSKGLETEFSQSIRPNDLAVSASMTTFGWSIDGGKDMDENSYPDIMIGTMSGYATYLRSLPIIDLKASIVITPDTPIDTGNTGNKVDVPDNPSYKAVAVDIKICFTYEKGIVGSGDQDIEVNYTLTSDYKNEKGFRMYFKPSRDDPKSQTLTGKTVVSTNKQESCTGTFKSYFNEQIYDFRHIYFRLTADVKDSSTFSNRVTLNDKLIDAAEDRVVMQSGCTKPSGVCQADLVLAPVDYTISPKGYEEIAIGRTDYIVFNINVTNKGEDDAFLSELSVTLPRNIIFNRRQTIDGQTEEDVSHIKCITKQEEDFTNKVICSLSSELKVGTSEIFGLSVITTNIEDLSLKTLDFTFNAYVQEPSEELSTLLHDNTRQVSIGVGYPAGIELLGRPLRERQPYSNDVPSEISDPNDAKSIGPDVRHELEVFLTEHGGPQHSFDSIEVMGYWPLFAPSTTNKLLDLQSYTTSTDGMECSFNSYFSVKGQGVSNTKYGTRSKKDWTEQVNAEVVGSVEGYNSSLDCSEDTESCEQFICSLEKLKQNETLTIQFLSILNTNSIDPEKPNLILTPYFEIIAVAQDTEEGPLVFGPAAKVKSPTEFVAVKSEESEDSYTWIIIVSLVLGLILLAIIIIVLVCCCNFCGNKEDSSGEYAPVENADRGADKV